MTSDVLTLKSKIKANHVLVGYYSFTVKPSKCLESLQLPAANSCPFVFVCAVLVLFIFYFVLLDEL